MKARRGYVVLAVMQLLLSGLLILFIQQQIKVNDQKFCQVVTGVTVNPVEKPVDPLKTPAQEHLWVSYLRFVKLGHDLGC